MTKKLSDSRVAENIRRLRAQIDEAALRCGRDPAQIALMAVTKTQTPELVNEAVACGVKLLGENKAQELCARYEQYDRDGVSIHFIGHLQSNKVRQIVDKVDMIHSVDSFRLAEEIEKQCAKIGKVMDVLVEVNVGGEESKTGVSVGEAGELIQKISNFTHLRVRGLMTIPPIANDSQKNEGYFAQIRQLSVDIKLKKMDNVSMDILSMGMSDDFACAIKHGSNIIRIGTAIFGARQYPAL